MISGLTGRFLFKFFAIFFLYFYTAWLGFHFEAIAGLVTLVWPPAGIAIAAVFLFGYSYLLSIFFAALLVNIFNGAPTQVGLLIALGNSFSTFIGVYLLKKVFNFNPLFDRLKDSLSLIAMSVVAPIMSASVGTISLVLGGVINPVVFESTWLIWWVGDSLGILIVGSLIIVWSLGARTSFRNIKLSFVLESIVLFSILLFICLVSFRGLFGIDSRRLPITQLLYPTLILFCLRLNTKLSITAVFVVAVISVWGTYSGFGPFVRGQLEESLLYLLIFIASIAVTFIILSSVMAERKKLHSLKDEFISAASHELRTPVTTIKAYIQLMGRQLQNKSRRRKENAMPVYISRVEEQIERLVKLIHELLDVSRIESGKIDLEYSRFNVRDLIGEMVKDYERTTKSHKIVYKGNGRFFVTADRYRISQVLINLISNAIKFSPNSNKIVINAFQEKKWVTFSIQDFGIGIDQKYQTEIFERFFQTEHKKLYSASGLGLGLYLSSEIVKKHGGKIWVKSDLMHGSTFFFMIPINKY